MPEPSDDGPIEIEEENYFFRAEQIPGDRLLDISLRQEGVIVPEWRRQEAINFVKGGLEDFSISRQKRQFAVGHSGAG